MSKNLVYQLIDLFSKDATSENVKTAMDTLKQELAKLEKNDLLTEEDKQLAKEALKYLQSKTEN